MRREREQAQREYEQGQAVTRRRHLEEAKRRGAFRDCPECPWMVEIPAGSFTIGSAADEAGREDGEGPRHEVRIAEPFAIGVFEVTFAQWDACVAAGGCGGHQPDDRDWAGATARW